LQKNIINTIKIDSSNFTSANTTLVITNCNDTEIDNSLFDSVTLVYSGIDLEESQLVVDNCQFGDSGAVGYRYIIELTMGTFAIKNSKIDAKLTFGGISVINSGTTSLINTTIENCSAGRGAGIYYYNVETATISEGCVFYMNTAQLEGGAIYVNNSTLFIDSTNITYNSAIGNGPAISCSDSLTGIINYDNETTIISNNSVPSNSSLPQINNCAVDSNAEFASSLVFSSEDDGGGSSAWIWIIVALVAVLVIVVIISGVAFFLYSRKRSSYTTMAD